VTEAEAPHPPSDKPVVAYFQTFSDAQEYLATALGGSPYDYARDNPATLAAADRAGVRKAVESAIALSRASDPEVMASTRKRRPPPTPGPLTEALNQEGLRCSLTDSGNAQRFVAAHGEDVRYVREFGEWLTWSGLHWQPDLDGEVVRRAQAMARAIYAEAAMPGLTTGEAAAIAKHARASEQLRSIKATIELARAVEGITIQQAALDPDPMLLGVENGVVDLREGDLAEVERDQLITRRVNAAFDPEATCPHFERFLAEIMDERAALVEYLQRLVGYCLTGRTDEQVIVFAYGTGANGKSTLLTLMRELWGGYAEHTPAETLLVKHDEAVRADIARLRGARLVTSTESEDGKRLAEGLVKTLTGGDPVTARHLYREFFEYRPQFKIILASNHKPVIRGDDHGIWRRIHLLPFAVTIPPERRDKDLAEKLRAEWPGILAWAVRGCLEWQRVGLAPPEEVQEATKEYREDSDLIGRWLLERCIVDRGATVAAAVAYRDYSKWIEGQGAHPMSLMAFSRKLRERGFERRKSSSVLFLGLGLLADESQAEGGLPL
jgi:putative DNA primase/helicase